MKVLLIFVSILAFYTCTTTKTTKTAVSPTSEEVIIFKKGGCRGFCPIYTLTLFSDGKALYDGSRFTNRLGKHEKMLSQSTIDDLVAVCEKANLNSLPDTYESRIPDLPSSTLTYAKGATSKTIFWREQADDTLKAIGKQIEDIAKEEAGWTILAQQELPVGAISNEFIINLQTDVAASDFAKVYGKYGLKPIEKLQPRGNYWSMSYDESTLPPYQMLNLLYADEKSIMVEFNHRIQQRN